MTKVLITGGSGFIGSHLVEECVSRLWDVTVIDDESAPENTEFYKIDGAKYATHDINDYDATRSLYDGVEYVFHLAARSRIQPTLNGDPRNAFENNVMGTQRVVQCALEAGVKKVIYSGTSSVYGLANEPPHAETMQADCLNPYSVSKFMGEQVGNLYHRLHGLPFITLRYFNVYGEREPLRGPYAPVIGLFKRQMDRGEPLTIVGDGEQRRDFTYVKDVVHANILAAKCDVVSGIFNIGTGKNYSINQIASMVGPNALRTVLPSRPGEARFTCANNTKAQKLLGWYPRHTIEGSIYAY